MAAGVAAALEAAHDVGPLILERADAAEQRGCLDDDVVDALPRAACSAPSFRVTSAGST